MRSLDQIFNDYGTDKGSKHGARHRYSSVYETLFAPIRHRAIKLLEIGIYRGASLKSWHAYFPQAKIYGVDMVKHKQIEVIERQERITIYFGDACDPQLIKERGFEVIIDDADHGLQTQINLLTMYWAKLKPGGLYIIEDLFVGELPWQRTASGPKNRAYLQYKGHVSAEDNAFTPKHPQDLNFLNRQHLPSEICRILDDNSHFLTITAVGKAGGLHMMLVIKKNEAT